MDDTGKERAILIHQRSKRAENPEAVQELQLLANSAGALVCETITGFRSSPDPATYLGRGKVEQLRQAVSHHGAELVLIDHDISPIQERNLERSIGCRVLDRTGLILDIFAQRAASHEGKLQVELAQLRHLSTRLVRGWTHLERQKGGIGLRGPGETQLETDRRLIGQRIKHLNKRLARVSSQRGVRRKSRRKVPVSTVSLIGYTNAGKSSLFNRLTGARVLAEDRLFATLDPTMRKLALPGQDAVILSDTVGFIRELPHTLVQAFHSTLEEVANADLLLHVVDIADPDCRERMHHVECVLAEIGANAIPTVTVYNKIDLIDKEPRWQCDADGVPGKVWVSAQSGAGTELLIDAVSRQLRRHHRSYSLRLPSERGRLRASLFRRATVVSERIDRNGDCLLEVQMSESTFKWLQQLSEFDDDYLLDGPYRLDQVVGA